MQCSSCQADLPITARFCPSCAAPVLNEIDIKAPHQVSIEWVTTTLKAQRYEIEPLNSNPNAIITRRDGGTLVLTLMKDAQIIAVQSLWNMKPPSWGQKADLLAAVNKANALNWLCTCYVSEAFDNLTVSSFVYLTERLSSRDLCVFLENFQAGVAGVIQNSGILKFAK
ncbi:zinc ribbon domain-containing protein [Trinickia mobilis]|uniref:zinc ribbon domain-containing protein n=1 Tax=Trinickia mobilis TaxID=2816356 RepID=UPI001A8D7A3E|nr:zinc ribbon domain-containing protein [Trinickia mobilis]